MATESQQQKLQAAYDRIDDALKLLITGEMSSLPFIRDVRDKVVDALNSLNRAIEGT